MENKTKLFIVFILIISIGSVIISHRTYLSFIQAKKFTLHFNTRAFEDVDQNFINDLIFDIPNLSATCIPIKAVKGMYLSNKKNPTKSLVYVGKIRVVNGKPVIDTRKKDDFKDI